MKTQIFQWAWNQYPATPDPLMTRQRAAILLRAWRRASRASANYRNIIECKRIAPHTYYVVSNHGEAATMVIGA